MESLLCKRGLDMVLGDVPKKGVSGRKRIVSSERFNLNFDCLLGDTFILFTQTYSLADLKIQV